MDNYPENLAPEFNEGGGVVTPFREWWERVRNSFPTVPENVAQYWLHEHWGGSPFGWLPSRAYSFKLTEWPADRLGDIRSRRYNYEPSNEGCLANGDYLINHCAQRGYRTAKYMAEHRNFPVPIIVLDNRDGHLRAGHDGVPHHEDMPASFVLIEGHCRFNMALYLHSEGRFTATPNVWLMKRECNSTGATLAHG